MRGLGGLVWVGTCFFHVIVLLHCDVVLFAIACILLCMDDREKDEH